MRVVITGSSGYIGQLIKSNIFFPQGYDVIFASRKLDASGYSRFLSYSDCPDADLLIHLGECSDVQRMERLGTRFCDEQIKTAEALVPKYDRVIYLSSTVLYGHSFSELINEENAVTKNLLYQQVKSEVESLFRKKGTSTILRLSNLYGENAKPNTLIYDILMQLKSDTIHIRKLDSKRDYISVSDFLSLFERSIFNFTPGTYNLGSGRSFTPLEIAERLLCIAEKNVPVLGATSGEVDSVLLDMSKTISVFRWNPTDCLLLNGLQKIYNNWNQR